MFKTNVLKANPLIN